MACAEKGTKRTGIYTIDAVDPENVKGSMRMAMSGSDHTMTVSSTFTAKWIGKVCGKGD